MTEYARIRRSSTTCLIWGIVLLALGATSYWWGYVLPYLVAESRIVHPLNLWGGNALLHAIQFVQMLASPVGGALLGAGVVLRVLAPRQGALATAEPTGETS